MKVKERHNKAARLISEAQQVYDRASFPLPQHVAAQIIADCEASSDPLAVAVRLERAEAEVARLREALRKYGHHSFGCPVTMTGASDCYCGLEVVLAEAALGKDGV